MGLVCSKMINHSNLSKFRFVLFRGLVLNIWRLLNGQLLVCQKPVYFLSAQTTVLSSSFFKVIIVLWMYNFVYIWAKSFMLYALTCYMRIWLLFNTINIQMQLHKQFSPIVEPLLSDDFRRLKATNISYSRLWNKRTPWNNRSPPS